MNAAEITDKLGLHSLRQRAWVCLPSQCVLTYVDPPNIGCSTSNPLALPPVMVSMRVSSGSLPASARLASRWRIEESYPHGHPPSSVNYMVLVRL
jgi:hypothetical protein